MKKTIDAWAVIHRGKNIIPQWIDFTKVMARWKFEQDTEGKIKDFPLYRVGRIKIQIVPEKARK